MNFTSLTAAITPLNIRSCLISRRGELLFEHYRDSNTADELSKINSCTKSILSALICLAMEQGLLPQPETAASQFFPQLLTARDVRKRNITLQHLLTMTAGFNWTEFGGQNSFPRMTRSSNWVDFALAQPLANDPGTRMVYNSGLSQMLSAMLVRATGMSTNRYAELHLFGPLGIQQAYWEQDPQGIHTGGFGLWLRPVDMLKFGQLYLDQGVWNGEPLLSREIVQQSLRPAIKVEAPYSGIYAWHWWADSFGEAEQHSSSTAPDYYYARGFGGQFIYIVPSLDIVVVLTADKERRDKPPTDIYRHYIVPLLIQ